MKGILKKYICLYLAISLLPLSVFFFSAEEKSAFSVYDTANKKTLKLSEEEYVLGALMCEMPPTFHIEALKAQAVLIYTNAVRSVRKGEKTVASVDTDNFCGYSTQKKFKDRYGENYSTYYAKMQKAVSETLGSIVSYKGNIIFAPYHSMCAGRTENAESVWGEAVSYLVSVESDGDIFSPNFYAEKKIEKSKIEEILSDKAKIKSDYSDFLTDVELDAAGYVKSAKIGGKSFSGTLLRSLFSLRSAAFEVSVSENEVVFTTKGYGHGVGMSQYGADFSARQGEDYISIIKHYYSGVQVNKL